jgi:hypothetical protein
MTITRINSSQLSELKLHLKLMNEASEHELTQIFYIIKHMQADLELPDLPVEDLVEIFTSLEEVRDSFKLKSVTFNHLNEILTEVNNIKQILNISKELPLEDVIQMISPDDVISLCNDSNSRLAKLLRYC